MKKVKLLLEPAEVEMIRDALQICYDDDCLDDDDMLEGLCQVFGILSMSGNFVKVKVDERTHYEDECDCDDRCNSQDTNTCNLDGTTDTDFDDDCQCDECRADRGLPPLEDDANVDPDAVDPDNSCWEDTDDDDGWNTDDDVTDDNGITEKDLEKIWNAREPWNTEKK